MSSETTQLREYFYEKGLVDGVGSAPRRVFNALVAHTKSSSRG